MDERYDDFSSWERVEPGDVSAPAPPAVREPQGIAATAFRWRDPRAIDPRPWLYGHHLIRGYVSGTIAPGGVGKSTLAITDAIAMAAGMDLVGCRPHAPLRIWYWCGEDPRDELERRVLAAMLHHGVNENDLEGRLFIDSGREVTIKVAEMKGGAPLILSETLNRLEAAIRDSAIDVLIIDPFVSIHSLDENSNGAMDMVVKALAGVAHRTGCAIEIIHHARKLNGADADIDSARGGSAIAAAVRAARVLNPMTADAAANFGIAPDERRSFVRVDGAKANLAPAAGARWVRIIGEPLGNYRPPDRDQDWVGVAVSWSPPTPREISPDILLQVQLAVDKKDYRANWQAENWVGHAIGPIVGAESREPAGRKQINKMLDKWFASGALRKGQAWDSHASRPVVEVGEWVKPSATHHRET